MREIDEMIENFHDNEDEMTEEQLYDAIASIILHYEFDSWELLDNLGVFVIPHSEWEDKYGHIQCATFPERARISNYYKKILTEEHAKRLMRHYMEFYDDMTTDWGDF